MYLYPPRTKFRGVYRNLTLSVRLSVRLSVQIRVRSITFFIVWHWLTIFGTWVYHHETMCRVHSSSRYDLELWPQGQIYRVFDMFSFPAHTFFVVWHWPTIFGKWVYYHKTMCRVHSWSRYDHELWPQGQIYRVFDMFSCPACNFIGGLTLAYHIWHMGLLPWSITAILHILLARLYGIDSLTCLGWDDPKCRYWWVSVLL